MEARHDADADPVATVSAGIRVIIKGAAAPAALTADGQLRSRYERALSRHGFSAA